MTRHSDEEIINFIRSFTPGGTFEIADREEGGQIYSLVFSIHMNHLVPKQHVGSDRAMEAGLIMVGEMQRAAETFLGLTIYSRARTRAEIESILELVNLPGMTIAKLHYDLTGILTDFDEESEHLEAATEAEVEQAREYARQESEDANDEQ